MQYVSMCKMLETIQLTADISCSVNKDMKYPQRSRKKRHIDFSWIH